MARTLKLVRPGGLLVISQYCLPDQVLLRDVPNLDSPVGRRFILIPFIDSATLETSTICSAAAAMSFTKTSSDFVPRHLRVKSSSHKVAPTMHGSAAGPAESDAKQAQGYKSTETSCACTCAAMDLLDLLDCAVLLHVYMPPQGDAVHPV